jgi:hypothetical protein
MVIYVLKGHDFSRANKRQESSWALQAAEKLPYMTTSEAL